MGKELFYSSYEDVISGLGEDVTFQRAGKRVHTPKGRLILSGSQPF